MNSCAQFIIHTIDINGHTRGLCLCRFWVCLQFNCKTEISCKRKERYSEMQWRILLDQMSSLKNLSKRCTAFLFCEQKPRSSVLL